MFIFIIGILFGLYQLQFVFDNAMSAVLAVMSLSFVFVYIGRLVYDCVIHDKTPSETVKRSIKGCTKPVLLFAAECAVMVVLLCTQYFCGDFGDVDSKFKSVWYEECGADFAYINSVWLPGSLKAVFVYVDELADFLEKNAEESVKQLSESEAILVRDAGYELKERGYEILDSLRICVICLLLLIGLSLARKVWSLFKYTKGRR